MLSIIEMREQLTPELANLVRSSYVREQATDFQAFDSVAER
jgi:hypothetical protein